METAHALVAVAARAARARKASLVALAPLASQAWLAAAAQASVPHSFISIARVRLEKLAHAAAPGVETRLVAKAARAARAQEAATVALAPPTSQVRLTAAVHAAATHTGIAGGTADMTLQAHAAVLDLNVACCWPALMANGLGAHAAVLEGPNGQVPIANLESWKSWGCARGGANSIGCQGTKTSTGGTGVTGGAGGTGVMGTTGTACGSGR